MNEREQFIEAATEAINRTTMLLAGIDQTRAAFEAMLESIRAMRDAVKGES